MIFFLIFLFVLKIEALPLTPSSSPSSSPSPSSLSLSQSSSLSKFIYLEPGNLFPSGQSPEKELASLVQREKRYLWYHVGIHPQKGWLPSEQVLVPLQFSRKVYNPFSLKLYEREGTGKIKVHCQQAPYTHLSLVKVEGYWARVQGVEDPCKKEKELWTPIAFFKTSA